jgi:dTDP-4-amino-4,6-dideoxygalactose transaminase
MRPRAMPYARHVYHIYAVRSGERSELQRTLRSYGILTGIHYPIPVHLQEGYRDPGYVAGDFPHAERAAREVLSLPMYPELSNIQIEFVSAAVHHNVHAL